jgi:hypothetical protein
VATILQDNFETDLAKWTVYQTGDGSASVSTDMSHTGNCAGRLSISSAAGSSAYISKDLGGEKTDVWATGWFNVTQAGAALNNVPLLRFFEGTDRVVEVIRSNDDDSAWVGILSTGGRHYEPTYALLTLDTWHQVTLHVIPNTTTTTIQVWIDGNSVYSTTTADLVLATHIARVQIGPEFDSQQGIEYFDDVVIGAN